MTLTFSKLERFLEELFQHYIVLKMYHFQTSHFGGHKTSDVYLTNFMLISDKFMEVAQGIFGTVKQQKIKIDVKMATDKTIVNEIDFFISKVNSFRDEDYPELWAISDTLAADAQQLKYLLSFK